MPESKKPLIRYQMIDRCIRNTGQQYDFQKLLTEINEDLADRNLEPIGKTTFYQDIKDMQVEFGAPIETYWRNRKKYYRYSDPDYGFGNQPLNQGEIEHLRDSVTILNRFSGIPGFEWIDEVASKLEVGTFDSQSRGKNISFESNEFLEGKEHIGPLFNAISNYQVLRITYQTFTSFEVKVHTIHPYHLKEHDSRWYVFGLYPKRDALLALSVDRIKKIEVLEEEPFIKNKEYDFEEYFEDFIGIRRDSDQLERVILHFNALMAPYVKTKPIHGSQKKVEEFEDGSLTISLDIIINFELENLLFSFKDNVQVLGPEKFKNRFKTILKNALSLYK